LIVADTHVWLWWLSTGEFLSRDAMNRLNLDQVGVSPASFYEIATAVARGRILLDRSCHLWIQQAVSRSQSTILPLTMEIAITAGELPRDILRDPIDRIIVATALHHRAPLITKDEKIRAAGVVETIW
jgi:PIN domain nuclease of toxin-antitoxin system